MTGRLIAAALVVLLLLAWDAARTGKTFTLNLTHPGKAS